MNYLILFWQKICLFYSLIFAPNSLKLIVELGELVVVGKGEIEIDIGYKYPIDTSVRFVNDCTTVPCNPHHDRLNWKIKKVHNSESNKKHFMLVINWNVSGIRVIEWTVCN